MTGTIAVLSSSELVSLTMRCRHLKKRWKKTKSMVQITASTKSLLQAAVDKLYPYSYVETQAMSTEAAAREIAPFLFKLSEDDDPPPWMQQLSNRFKRTVKEGILFRPQIVSELRQEIKSKFHNETLHDEMGFFVQGPQGVGKSHSLVSLAYDIELERRKKRSPYHVTFVTNCNKWWSVQDFLGVVFSSLGVNDDEVKFHVSEVKTNYDVEALVKVIDSMLCEKNIKWIFIFDQVNALFARTEHQELKDVHKLPFPYNVIPKIRRAGRILSTISASANNEVSHREGHMGFQPYSHTSQWSLDEVQKIIGGDRVLNKLPQTGLIPLQVSNLMSWGDTYEGKTREDISQSVLKLYDQVNSQALKKKLFHTFVVETLLKSTTASVVVDRKYFLGTRTQGRTLYEPLFPLVEEVYMSCFWDMVMKYINENERLLLNVCARPGVDQGSRGRHFELIVIQRCIKAQFHVKDGEKTILIPHFVHQFTGKELPDKEDPLLLSDTMLVPYDPNFGAVDFLLICGSRVIGVQVHVGKHKETATSFEGMCRAAGWQERFDKIELWYLSPTEQTKGLVTSLVGTHRCQATRNSPSQWSIDISAKTISDFSCLKNIAWPTTSN